MCLTNDVAVLTGIAFGLADVGVAGTSVLVVAGHDLIMASLMLIVVQPVVVFLGLFIVKKGTTLIDMVLFIISLQYCDKIVISVNFELH